MTELLELTELVDRRFDQHLRAIDPDAPKHRVEFSRRITESWALIYYRRHLVRLSPYLFLLEANELQHGSHWGELDATLRHEAAHAAAFHRHDHTGHGAAFHAAMDRLGLVANGGCDLGPENAAFRYLYACPTCDNTWHRRAILKGNWSCGVCAPGRFDPAFRLALREKRDLATRLRERHGLMIETITAAHLALRETPLVTSPQPVAPTPVPVAMPGAPLSV